MTIRKATPGEIRVVGDEPLSPTTLHWWQRTDGEWRSHIAAWDAALTDDEIAELLAGHDPRTIRRDKLRLYSVAGRPVIVADLSGNGGHLEDGSGPNTGDKVMTHSGGKAHTNVGDRGQRYEVTVFDESQNERIVIGWSDDASVAMDMGTAAESRPSWKFAQVRDRHVVVLTPAEIQSNYNRVQWAEDLIRQLPATHDGRNSWLLNYGTGHKPRRAVDEPSDAMQRIAREALPYVRARIDDLRSRGLTSPVADEFMSELLQITGQPSQENSPPVDTADETSTPPGLVPLPCGCIPARTAKWVRRACGCLPPEQDLKGDPTEI